MISPTLLPTSPLPTSTIRKLQNRRSYMARAPFQQHRSARQHLADLALRLCPVVWLGPAILRAHDMHEYERDRRRLHEVYVGYQEHRGREGGGVIGGVRGGGSVVDLRTYLAPVEGVPLGLMGLVEGGEVGGGDGERGERERDPWWCEGVVGVDPWRLRPVNEIV